MVKDLGQIIHKISINDILKEDFTLLIEETRRIMIMYNSIKCWMVFSKKTQTIVTFLPWEETRLSFKYPENHSIKK